MIKLSLASDHSCLQTKDIDLMHQGQFLTNPDMLFHT